MRIADVLIERRAAVLLAIVSAAYAAGLALWLAHNPDFLKMDFYAYWRSAHESAAEAYGPRANLPFPYLPTMLIWVAPLALIPFWTAFFCFLLVSAIAFLLAGRPFLSPAQAALAILAPPMINGFSVGQCSILLAAALLWACRARNRLVAGILLGLIASAKPQLVIMAPVLLVIRRDWRAFWAAGAAWAAMILASLALFGVGAWQSWLASLEQFESILGTKHRLGVALSPGLTAQSLHLPALPFIAAGIAAGLWLVWSARRSSPVVQCAAIACASLLSAPYAMVYDLAPLMPFLIIEIWAGSLVAAIAASGAFAPVSLPLAAWRIWRTQAAAARPPLGATGAEC